MPDEKRNNPTLEWTGPASGVLVFQGGPARGRPFNVSPLSASMAPRWKHPHLGVFTRSGSAWKGVIELPAFAAFSFDTGYDNARRSNGRYELELCDRATPPTDELIAAVLALRTHQRQVVAEIVRLLWESLAGTGRYIPIGDMQAVTETLARQNIPAPRSAESLTPLLGLYRITVQGRAFEHDEPVIWLDFHAALEEEHGIGVLTDGQHVLGIGYAGDVYPFDWKPTKSKPRFGPNAETKSRSGAKRDGVSFWRRLFGGR
jgi:hypothetical protein